MKKQAQFTVKTDKAMKIAALAFVWGTPLILMACGSGKEKATLETRETKTTENAIDSYASNATEEAKADVETAFATLDKEIAELEARVAATDGEKRAEAEAKLEQLKQQRNELRGDYTKAKFDALVEDVKNAVR